MDVKVEKKEGNVCVIDINVEQKLANTEYEKACKRIAQKVNIPGFRRGKAPRAKIEGAVGIETIKGDAIEVLIKEGIAKAIQGKHIKYEDMISSPRLTNNDFALDKDSKLTVEIELRPEVKLPQYKGLTVEVEGFKTPEDAMEQQIKAVCERFATIEKTEDKEAKKDSIVLIDFDGYVDGEAIKGGKAAKYSLDLANSTFIPGFAEAIVGKPVGEEFTIDVKFPDAYHNKDIAGKPAQFKILIHEVQKKVVPEINDEIAKKVSNNLKTVDELKKDIQKYLEITEKKENETRSADAVYKKVLEGVEVNIQDSIIEREVGSLIREMEQRAAAQGLTLQSIYDEQGEENIKKEMREEAIARIKNSLVIDKIAHAENITVLQKDIEEKIQILAQTYGTTAKEVVEQVQKNPMIINSISQQALSEKITAFLVKNNTVVFK